MVKKFVERNDFHPDTYRITCTNCNQRFEAQNEDFRYMGLEDLICTCPWCGDGIVMNIRKLRKLKIQYGPTINYMV